MGVLFISHSSKNNDQAVRVRDWLRSQGYAEVFLDLDPAHGLAPGHRWQEELKRAGENCAAVVVLVSPDWVASTWCQTEFLVADQLGKRIFPVMIAPTPFDSIRLELRSKFQIADVSTPDIEADGLQRLAFGLKRAGLDPKSFDWPPQAEPNRAVYRGLQALDVQDAAIFFGRDAAITRGLDELRRLRDGAPQRILVILGASGAGKSSFLRAGLMARLRRDEENFLVLPIVRPERAALRGPEGLLAGLSKAAGKSVSLANGAEDLARAFADLRAPVVERLARNAEAAREAPATKPPTIVIPLDQAEELFGAENTERAQFCEVLAKAIAADGNAVVVATIRSDSYEPLQTEPLLASAPQLLFNLQPIAAGAFQEVIAGPARLAKPPIVVEPELIQQLLADLDAADALPLLAFTLERLLTQFGADGRLSLADYSKGLGGIAGAIQSAVAAALGPSPTPQTLALARRLFVPALVQVDQDGVKRRVARRQDIPADAQALAGRFVEQRLLIVDRRVIDGREVESIEVAHEAILRQWPALVSWIAEERDALRSLDGVRAAAREWQAHEAPKQGGNRESWLTHRGDRLKEAEAISARPDFAAMVAPEMGDYLAACRKDERKAHGRRRSLQTLAGVSVVAVLAAGFGFATQDKWLPQLEQRILVETKYEPFLNTPAALAAMADGAVFQECEPATAQRPSSLCPVMVLVPAGQFRMGDEPRPQRDENNRPIVDAAGKPVMAADERPLQRVARFAASQTEVTFDQWAACVAGGGCKSQPTPGDATWGRGDRPVINVSWEDAQEYVKWLKQMTGADYRLLSEAEWEYAARGGTTTRWSFGDDESALGDYGWFTENSDGKAQPVHQKKPNPFGLYDVHGNVREWVETCYDLGEASAQPDGNANKSLTCSSRVIRGGSWFIIPQYLRSANRVRYSPTIRFNFLGFRLARTVLPPES